MKLHLLGLPHTNLSDTFLSCAYTQKLVKFCKMMGHHWEILYYGGEVVENTPGISEHIVCMSEKERRDFFGSDFDVVRRPVVWDSSLPYWRNLANRTVPELVKRAAPRDLLLVIGGVAQKPIADAIGPALLPVEWGVGYEGIFTNFCAFESYAWMHYLYGKHQITDGRAYDQVIPNFFDPEDFTPGPSANAPYLLFVGRIVKRKGPHIAAAIAERLGMPLVVAGSGGEQKDDGTIVGEHVEFRGPRIEYVGPVDRKERARLMSGAACLLAPTLYNEPFGGVAVEAMMSGCPVVASDWGAFPEIVGPDMGRTFRTIGQGVEAVREAMCLSRPRIARLAKEQFSLDAVRPMFGRWFRQLETLWGKGYYA